LLGEGHAADPSAHSPESLAAAGGRCRRLTGADPLAEIDAALSTREPLYRECAGMVIDTAQASPEEVIEAILRGLETPKASRCPPGEA